MLVLTIPGLGWGLEIGRLTDCESLEHWSPNGQLSRECDEGAFAVYSDVPAGEVGILSFDFAHTGVDLSSAYALSFSWRAEGYGLRSVKLKVRNYPLAGGMEAVYSLWPSAAEASSPSTWRRAVVVLSSPTYDDWGGEPDLVARYVTFRTETVSGSQVRLAVDDVVVLPPTFEWDPGTPWREGTANVDADFDGDGAVGFGDFIMFAEGFGSSAGDQPYRPELDLDGNGSVGFADFVLFAQYYGQGGERWRMPVTFRNLGSEALPVTLGRGGLPLVDVTLPPSGEQVADFLLPPPSVPYSQQDPLQGHVVRLWAQVGGYPVTRTEKVVKTVKPVELPPHPRLLLSSAGLNALRQRIADQPWAQARWRQVRGRANYMRNRDLVLPPRGGNWWHWYASPTTGATLRRGDQIGDWEWEHIDSVTGEVFTGDPAVPSRDYDGCVIAWNHNEWATAVRTLGLAYQVEGDSSYARRAREILLAYADRYLQYPLHNTRGEARIGGGRVHPQTLDESGWLIPICQGADLVWDVLSEDDRQAVAEKLLQPAAREVILPHIKGVHNIQCWKNSAVGLVGLLLGDDELVWEAVENPEQGYWKQMAAGVTPDGAWWEGAWGYHFYTLSALWGLTEGARNCGLDLYGEALRRMYDAPLAFSRPGLHLPAFNDSDEVDLRGQSSAYELAYARFGDAAYLDLLTSRNREDDNALWFGVGDLPAPAPRAWQGENFPHSGYAILAAGEGDGATWLCLKYGPQGGVHGHFDKLNFVLASGGGVVAVDPGTAQYGLPVQKGWYRTSLAHNTLVVDEASQAQAEGKCLAFGRSGGAQYAMLEAGAIYDGVLYRRTATLVDENLAVFVDQVDGSRERTLDVVYHQAGSWEQRPTGSDWAVPDKGGYRYLEGASVRGAVDPVTLSTRLTDAETVAIHLAGGNATEVITATGIGQHADDRVPVVIFRRQAEETTFVWSVALDGQEVGLRSLAVAPAGGGMPSDVRWVKAVEVTRETGGTQVLLVNPERKAVSVEMPDGSAWETAKGVGVKR